MRVSGKVDMDVVFASRHEEDARECLLCVCVYVCLQNFVRTRASTHDTEAE